MRILYITTNFAARTHTFITREIEQVRSTGCEVELLALRRIPPEAQTQEPECSLEGCRYVYPASASRVIADATSMAVRHPRRFFSAWRRALSDPRDSLKAKLKLSYQLLVTCTLVRWVEGREYDRIHAHFASPPTTFAMYLSFLTSTPYSFTGHGADVFRDAAALQPKLEHAAGIICISRYNCDYYRHLVPTLTDTQIVHCGIDLSKFPFAPNENTSGPLSILAVGRCVKKKGFSVLLQSLSQLPLSEGSWMCTIAGDGPLLSQLQAESRALGLAESVKFVG
ncbi:MAG: glycosyltransferase [bacterium]|nr:glycosyltransferase [bacterium]